MSEPANDKSNGYEEHARMFMRARNYAIGPDVVRAWCRTLPPGATVLELACGSGVPITQVLVEEGLQIWAIDPSPTMIRAFHERFPDLPVQCCPAEDSDFFSRS